jgi:hypothetical protein
VSAVSPTRGRLVGLAVVVRSLNVDILVGTDRDSLNDISVTVHDHYHAVDCFVASFPVAGIRVTVIGSTAVTNICEIIGFEIARKELPDLAVILGRR